MRTVLKIMKYKLPLDKADGKWAALAAAQYFSRISLLFVLLALQGCESEEAKQHHLYNLQNCKSQTYQADDVAFQPTENKTANELLGYEKLENRQRAHNYRAADCMAHEEKTTVEYQEAKHDDYGKVCGLNEVWSYGSCIARR